MRAKPTDTWRIARQRRYGSRVFRDRSLYTAVIDLTGDDFEFVMGNSRMAAALGVETLKGQSGTALLGEERADGVSMLRTAAVRRSHDPRISLARRSARPLVRFDRHADA